jgi:hypothetical protein
VSTICQGNDSRLSDDRTASGLRTASTIVVVSAATAPSSGQVLTATSGTVANWQTPTSSPLQRYRFGAVDFDEPNNSNWTVAVGAELTSDSLNAALSVRRFDDTTEEGVGFDVYVPTGATTMTLRFVSRGQTAPGSAKTVRPALYVRELPDNAAVEAWSVATLLTPVDIPTNTNWQYDSEAIALSTLSMVAGRMAQFELTRKGTDGSDNLSGDWTLQQLVVEFS